MAKRVKVTKKANKRISDIALYLESEFSYQAADNVVKAFYKTIDKLAEQPKIGREVQSSKSMRFINMDKHRQIFYRTYGNTVSIIDVFDTRQNPKKRPT